MQEELSKPKDMELQSTYVSFMCVTILEYICTKCYNYVVCMRKTHTVLYANA